MTTLKEQLRAATRGARMIRKAKAHGVWFDMQHAVAIERRIELLMISPDPTRLSPHDPIRLSWHYITRIRHQRAGWSWR